MKFKLSDLINLFYDDESPFEEVEKTPWEDGGKYSSCDVIFKYQDKTYLWSISRSGSYFTDYNYDWDWMSKEKREQEMEDCPEVEKVQVTIMQWHVLK